MSSNAVQLLNVTQVILLLFSNPMAANIQLQFSLELSNSEDLSSTLVMSLDSGSKNSALCSLQALRVESENPGSMAFCMIDPFEFMKR